MPRLKYKDHIIVIARSEHNDNLWDYIVEDINGRLLDQSDAPLVSAGLCERIAKSIIDADIALLKLKNAS
jgi:hypothetical protein